MMTSITGSSLIPARRGFTLIEVLVAVSILAIGMGGILRAYFTSVNAMEISQYNIDAACLLKAAMGSVEEKVITEEEMLPGVFGGEFTSFSDIKMDTTRSGQWLWDEEVRQIDFYKEKAATEGAGEKSEEGADNSLNEVKFTVVNPYLSPARKISVTTYFGEK